MLQWLTDLPKLIDAFISGVIEFCYRFFNGVILVTRHPLTGSRTLEADEEHLSSRTMLFCAVALFIIAVFFSFANLGSIAGTGLVHFFVMVIAAYVMFDMLAAFGSRYCENRTCSDPCDKVRDFLRYGFAGSLILFAIGFNLLEWMWTYSVSSANPLATFGPGWGSGLILIAMVSPLVLLFAFYHPIVIVINVIGRGRTRLRRALLVGGFATVLTVGTMGVLYVLLTSYGRIRDAVDGAVYVTPLTCVASAEGVHAAVVVNNTSATTMTPISRNTLALRLTYGTSPRSPREVVPFASLDDDVVIVDEGGVAKLIAEARPGSAAYQAFLLAGRPGRCELVKGNGKRRYEFDEAVPLEPAPAAAEAAGAAAKPAT